MLETKLKGLRRDQWQRGLDALPALPNAFLSGRNGEELATDEAAVWKRVLDYRIAAYTSPARILEMYAGLGISRALYEIAAPEAEVKSCSKWEDEVIEEEPFDFVDIDPFGAPWAAIERALSSGAISASSVVLVTNGEAMLVQRNIQQDLRWKTQYWGKQLGFWVVREYLPELEKLLKLPVRFFYAFPTSIRVVLSERTLPQRLFDGCAQWMWWLAKRIPPISDWDEYIPAR